LGSNSLQLVPTFSFFFPSFPRVTIPIFFFTYSRKSSSLNSKQQPKQLSLQQNYQSKFNKYFFSLKIFLIERAFIIVAKQAPLIHLVFFSPLLSFILVKSYSREKRNKDKIPILSLTREKTIKKKQT
jgi:hypothetical protein